MMRRLVADRGRRRRRYVTLRQFMDRGQGRRRPDVRIVITRWRRRGNTRRRCRGRTVLRRVRATLVRRRRRATAAAAAAAANGVGAAPGDDNVHLLGRILENVAGLLKSDSAQPTAIDVDDLVANLQTAIPAK